jgi:hypothetical protein
MKQLRTVIALLVMVYGAASPGAWQAVHSVTYSEYSARFWAGAYGLDPDWFWSVAQCESSGNPYAVGPSSPEGAPYGLYQMKPATWQWLLALENADMSLAPHLTTYDPEWRGPGEDAGAPQAHIAAWAMAHGFGGLWQCH